MGSHQLTVTTDDSCGPVAVGAVTGATPERVKEAIREAAREDDQNPTHLKDTSFRHQARAVELLGFELLNLDGTKCPGAFHNRPTRRLCGLAF